MAERRTDRRAGIRPKKVTKTINDNTRIKMAIFFNEPIAAESDAK